jgi:7-cyano-7-deazaguanine reductase
MKEELLETKEAETDGKITHSTDELTALCPFSFGGRDFYELKITYRSEDREIETRSLKKYKDSYREDEISHEALTEKFFNDLMELLNPRYLRLEVNQMRRGGIDSKIVRENGEE